MTIILQGYGMGYGTLVAMCARRGELLRRGYTLASRRFRDEVNVF